MLWPALSSQAANFHLQAFVNEANGADIQYDFHLAFATLTMMHLSDLNTASDRPWVLHITLVYCKRKKQADSFEHLNGFVHMCYTLQCANINIEGLQASFKGT